MAAKYFTVICAYVFIMQCSHGQCLGRIGAGRVGTPLAGRFGAPLAASIACPKANPLIASLATPGLAGPALAAPALAVPPLAVPALTAPALAYDGCGGVASTGGGFPVTSASPIAPTGVSVLSENQIEGALIVGGNLPLLGSVTVEGAFPTAGAGAVSYGCGSGEVIITAEAPITTGILAPGPVGPAPALLGSTLGAGLIGPTFGSALAGSALAPGRFGARGGIAPGLKRGCGFGRAFH